MGMGMHAARATVDPHVAPDAWPAPPASSSSFIQRAVCYRVALHTLNGGEAEQPQAVAERDACTGEQQLLNGHTPPCPVLRERLARQGIQRGGPYQSRRSEALRLALDAQHLRRRRDGMPKPEQILHQRRRLTSAPAQVGASAVDGTMRRDFGAYRS